nr:Chain B, Latent membrane protein 2 [synthetic construct]
EEPPPPYED